MGKKQTRRKFFTPDIERAYRDYVKNAGLTAAQSRVARSAFAEGMNVQAEMETRYKRKSHA